MENVTYCFSVYPVVDTSEDAEWAESVYINADSSFANLKSLCICGKIAKYRAYKCNNPETIPLNKSY